MDFLNSIYSKSISENEKILHFWENYLNTLRSLNFNIYSEKLAVPVMVPVGNRMLFRGKLHHTNEVTVSLGADYFVKCSTHQAEVLRQHRIKDAQSKVDLYRKEREYLNSRMSFSQKNIKDNPGHEIVEQYSEAEDDEWRKQHRENVRKYKIKSREEKCKPHETTDEELWERLEELELREELEDELKKEEYLDIRKESLVIDEIKSNQKVDLFNKLPATSLSEPSDTSVNAVKTQLAPLSKLDLLQQVIDRQNELSEKLKDIKERGKTKSRTEIDLISRIDEIEQLENLEDEMDQLEDIIKNEDEYLEEQNEEEKIQSMKPRGVYFADEDDAETVEILFKHSEISPCLDPYDPEKGVQKPSDIYQAYEKLFKNETTCILKKTRYESDKIAVENLSKEIDKNIVSSSSDENTNQNKTIVVKDITEKVNTSCNNTDGVTNKRPISLFKKRRMLNNS